MVFSTWRFRNHSHPDAPFAGRCLTAGGAHWTFCVSVYYRWPFVKVLLHDPSWSLVKQFRAIFQSRAGAPAKSNKED